MLCKLGGEKAQWKKKLLEYNQIKLDGLPAILWLNNHLKFPLITSPVLSHSLHLE